LESALLKREINSSHFIKELFDSSLELGIDLLFEELLSAEALSDELLLD
jgi:hypothetical protein